MGKLGAFGSHGRPRASQAGERLRQLVADDFLGVYFKPLEERLVEQPSLLRAGDEVGPLHIVGQRQRSLQGIEDAAVIDTQFLKTVLSAAPLPPDTGLLLSEQLRAHLIGVMGLKQLALLASEPRQLGLGLDHLLVKRLGFLADIGANRSPDSVAVLVGELHVLASAVVALDGRFNRCRPMMALRADAATAAAAHEVFVCPAVAFGLDEHQPGAALRAVQAAAQIVMVPPGTLATLALGVEQVLNLLECRFVN